MEEKIIKKKSGKVLAALILASVVGGTSIAGAQQVGSVNAYDVTYQGKEVYTGYVGKDYNNGYGVVNLSNDTGTAYITATMGNSAGASRGIAAAQRGERVEFANTGSAGYVYRLGLVKTNSGTPVRVVGTWSPDNK
ncbi:hypothetical protein ACOI1C_22055 [Bacillus sp. DJP31]|uniref:hypothetical protein n=1 Tax=Bacillus sp. DJP31 TaxID=3409789 RepID=UPI003BB5406A